MSLGSLYALVAIGLSMVFGILRMTNFAHGDMMMVGAFAAWCSARWALPSGWPRSAASCLQRLAGILVERIAYRPVRGVARRDAATDQPRRDLHPRKSRHPDLHLLAAQLSDPDLMNRRSSSWTDRSPSPPSMWSRWC